MTNIELNTEPQYTTPDTALAAYLVYLGFPTISVNSNGSRTTFTFEQTNDLQDAVNLWNSSMASGNLRLFFDCYKSMLRRIKGTSNNHTR